MVMMNCGKAEGDNATVEGRREKRKKRRTGGEGEEANGVDRIPWCREAGMKNRNERKRKEERKP